MQLSFYNQMNPTLEHFFSKTQNNVNKDNNKQIKPDDKTKEVHKSIEGNKCDVKSKKNNEKDKIKNQKSLHQYFKPQNPIKLQQKQDKGNSEIKENFRDNIRDQDLESQQYEYLYNQFENKLRKEECKSAPQLKRRNRNRNRNRNKNKKEKPQQSSILTFIHKRKIQQEQKRKKLDLVDVDWKKINKQLSQLHLIPSIDKKKIQTMKKSVEKPQKQTKINQIKQEENYQISKQLVVQNSKLRKTRNKNSINYREKSSPEPVQKRSQEKKQTTRKSPRKIPVIQHKLHLVTNKKEILQEDRRNKPETIEKIEKICIEYPKQGHSIHIDYKTMEKHHKQTLKLLFQSYI